MSFELSPIARLLALGGELSPPPAGVARRKYDLAHMRTLLAALETPGRKFPSVLIGGTNGKGSTAATLASILQAAGLRTGLYTSPHLEVPNERIRVNGEAISDDALTRGFLQVEAAASALVDEGRLPYTPSFFEVVTAIGFLHFASAGVELAVLEVGLGGRLDATNVVDPLVSVLTDISLDHMEWLGTTLTAITREKTGILRPGGLLVTLPQHPEANQAIGEAAVPLGVEAISATEYLPPRSVEPAAAASLAHALRNHYDLTLPLMVFGGGTVRVDSPLGGAHQQRNIALAICAAVVLHTRYGFPLALSALETGISQTSWRGRLELLASEGRRIGPAPVLLDAAHNPAGAWALRAALSSLTIAGPRTLVFGCMADKALDELAQVLFPVFDEVLLTAARSPRAAAVTALAAAAERTGVFYRTFPTVEDAFLAARLATPENGLIVVAGSISLLGELEHALHEPMNAR